MVLRAEAAGGLPRLSELLVEDSWRRLLGAEFGKPYWAELEAFVRAEWGGSQMVFPPKDCIFRWVGRPVRGHPADCWRCLGFLGPRPSCIGVPGGSACTWWHQRSAAPPTTVAAPLLHRPQRDEQLPGGQGAGGDTGPRPIS